MHYAILIYDVDEALTSLTPDEETALMAKHDDVRATLAAAGKLGPVVRLDESGKAKSYRPGPRVSSVTDGPFAETKEQLLGLYIVECATMDDALEIARSLPPKTGVLEIRPVLKLMP